MNYRFHSRYREEHNRICKMTNEQLEAELDSLDFENEDSSWTQSAVEDEMSARATDERRPS